MKQRVALIATCLNIALCVAFLFLCAGLARQTMQADSLRELQTICRLAVAAGGETNDREKMLSALRGATSSSELAGLVYAPDGQLDYTSRVAFKDALTPIELSNIANQTMSMGVRSPREMDSAWLFAFEPLPDGAVFAVVREAHALLDVFSGKFVLLILLALGIGGITVLIFQFVIQRTNRFVDEVQRVLENFSEGQFDSQIHNVGDTLEQSAHFNAIIGRIRDRVFKQKTRNQAFNTIIGHMENGILAVDEKLNVMLVTPAAKRLLNIVGTPEGLPIGEVSKDVNMSQAFMSGMAQSGVYTSEARVRSASGRSPTPIRLYVSPMRSGEDVVGAVALIADITEIRSLEQVRTDFAANVSHELKTPLTSIMGFVETLQNGAIDNPQMAKKFLRIIMVEADRLKRLINDILSITKLESGNSKLRVERVRLDKMASDICDMLEFQASEKNVTIYKPSNAVPSHIMANPDSAEQMLINLIENAVKYNKEGGIVRVNIYNQGSKVALSIADTGIGIAKEDIPKLFERFYRVDKGRSRSMGGTGLGLAIVKYLLRTMGGTIEVHSTLGEGTEFALLIPSAECASPETVQAQSEE